MIHEVDIQQVFADDFKVDDTNANDPAIQADQRMRANECKEVAII
jgi:hypothetical protein